MTFGVNETGFNLKRLADIQAELQAALELITDPDTGETLQINFNEDDPFINAINTLMANNAKSWEALQMTYNQWDPGQNTGAAQSGMVQLNGLLRKVGINSTIPIELTGTPGTLIPAGQRISDAQQLTIWITDTDLTIGGGGTITGTASSEEFGAFLALAGTVETILTPLNDWTAVTNTSDSTLGRIEEDDEILRDRRDISTEAPALSIVESIFSALLNLDDVTFARVFVNRTLVVDARGIPAKSIAAVVVGGTDEDIANTLFLRTPAGMSYLGTDSLTVTDIQGESYLIEWIRPTNVNIFIEVDVTVTNAGLFPSDGDDQIKAAIVTYAQSGAAAIGATDGFEAGGIVPGEDVRLSRLFTPVNSIPGHTIDRLEIGTPAVGGADIVIDFDELANFDSTNITVVVS